MPVFLVDMSLRSPGHDYAPLWDAMERAHAQRLMDTNWLVDVGQDAAEVTRALLSHLATGDKLFVLEFRPDSAWTGTALDDETKAWLAARLSGIRVGLDSTPNKPADEPVLRLETKPGRVRREEG